MGFAVFVAQIETEMESWEIILGQLGVSITSKIEDLLQTVQDDGQADLPQLLQNFVVELGRSAIQRGL